ncbi:hypothetical protein E2562_011449 [Oryza meyeriana var. granulata]|uniref:Uncharacterized protein n=1 Tax=Oryza meyeriana var. granulata TaxID=110450 RepID=A0A6G1D2T7_9ORYZ|nr:hypothetical protein E2562_011449 [Oryza meyeriana var. granulata]
MAKARLNVNLTTILGLSMVALLVLSAVQDAADAQVIDYPAMNHDRIPGTPQLNHPGAFANKYTRGCEKQEYCRDKKA